MPTLAVESAVLTACLACGWVHAHPLRCHESTAKTARVFRVGKADVFLMTPND
jgi:hypothetical protein